MFAFVARVVDGQNRADTQPLSIAILEPEEIKKGKNGGCGCSGAEGRTPSALVILLLLLPLIGRLSRKMS